MVCKELSTNIKVHQETFLLIILSYILVMYIIHDQIPMFELNESRKVSAYFNFENIC